MEDATKEIWSRHSSKLPMTKDLPRLAKLVTMYAYNHVGRLYLPTDSAVEAMRSLFVELATRIECNEELTNKISKEFPNYFSESAATTKQPLDLSTKLFFDRVIGEEETSKIHRLLKFCNQSIIAPAVKKLKVEVLTIANFTKDLGWEIEIEIWEDKIIASHIRKEMCLQGNFTYSWKLALVFDLNVTCCQAVDLTVVKLNFKSDIAAQKREEVTRLLQPLLDPVEQLVAHAESSSVLDLSHLHLSTLPRSVFTITSFKVCYLHCNKLVSLPLAYGSFVNLMTLWLSNNSFTIFPAALLEMKQLRELRLNDNQIKSLPDDMKSLSTLQELHLQNNLITIVSNSTLHTLPSLTLLDLRQNPLQEFSATSCASLEAVYLEDTPLYRVFVDDKLEKGIDYETKASSSSERLASPRCELTAPSQMSAYNSVLLSPRLTKRKSQRSQLSMSIAASISLTDSAMDRRLSISTPSLNNEATYPPNNHPSVDSGPFLIGTLILDNVSYPEVGKKYTQYIIENSGKHKHICCVQEIHLANHVSDGVKSPSQLLGVWLGDNSGKILTWGFLPTKTTLLSVLNAHSASIRALISVGDAIWTAGDDKAVHIWLAETETTIKTLTLEVSVGCLLHSGNFVIGGCTTGDVIVWDLLGNQICIFNVGRPVLSLCVEGDIGEELLWIGSEDSVLVNKSIKVGDVIGQLECLDSPVKNLVGRTTERNTTEIWCSTRQNTFVLEWSKEDNRINELRKLFSTDLGTPIHVFAHTTELLFLAVDRSIHVCDAKTEKVLTILKGAHSTRISNIIVVDDDCVWSIAEKRQINIWYLADIGKLFESK